MDDLEAASLNRLYSAFGMAAHAAQLVEKEMATVLLLPTISESNQPLSKELIAKTQQELDKPPLGELIKRFKRIATFGAGAEQQLEEANQKRIDLIHHFFARYNERMCSAEVRETMIAELDSIHDLLHPIYLRLRQLSHEAFLAMGLSEDQIQEHRNSLEAQLEEERKASR